MELNAIILAAGKGTRMCSLDKNKSKVSFKILEKPLINYVLDTVLLLGCQEIVTVVGFGGEVSKALVEPFSKTVWQTEQLGTGHALMQAAPLLKNKKGHTIVLCGDTPLLTNNTLETLIKHHHNEHNDLTVLTAVIEKPNGYGRIVREINGEVLKIVEQTDCDNELEKITEVNAGVYIFKNELLLKHLNDISTNNKQKELYLTDLVAIFKQHKLKVGAVIVKNSEEMLGINNRIQLFEATKIMQKRINEKHMLNGVTIINSENTYIGIDVRIGADCIIYPNNHIYGACEIGIDNYIGPDNYLENVTIKDRNTIIKSHIIDSVIGSENKVGPFARLRNHVEIDDKCNVGNFVEMKKAHLKEGTKAAHLTYIGDATIGKKTNIGCGTITANYDGENKFRTEIGDNVFVGSGTTIIAPVTIESDSFVAGGSTINEDVKTGDFAIARARQVNKAGYAKKYLKK